MLLPVVVCSVGCVCVALADGEGLGGLGGFVLDPVGEGEGYGKKWMDPAGSNWFCSWCQQQFWFYDHGTFLED